MLKAAQVGGPLSVLQNSRQGGPRQNERISKDLAWIQGYLRTEELQAVASLALFRCAVSSFAFQAMSSSWNVPSLYAALQ